MGGGPGGIGSASVTGPVKVGWALYLFVVYGSYQPALGLVFGPSDSVCSVPFPKMNFTNLKNLYGDMEKKNEPCYWY